MITLKEQYKAIIKEYVRQFCEITNLDFEYWTGPVDGHLSMFRHASRYGVVSDMAPSWWARSSYCATLMGYVSTNEQYIIDHTDDWFVVKLSPSEMLQKCKQDPLLFNLFRLTFCITTQISTSRELNRVSPNAIAERSTRYCSAKDGLEICKPWWFNPKEKPGNSYIFYKSWKNAEETYKAALETGMKTEDARGVLPLDTATKVIYTYSVKEWQHIIDLRYYGTTGIPHPNAKLVIGMVREQINQFAKENNIDFQV
mgnify:CR=1 FL=1